MRKTTLSLMLLVIASATLISLPSCSTGDDNFLEIKTLSPSAYLIPAKTTSCASVLASKISGDAPSSDINDKYFMVRGLKLTWGHAYNALSIALIRLRFTSDNLNGVYTCDISGDELTALNFLAVTPFTAWSASIPATGSYNTKTTTAMTCDLRCGGVTTKELGFRASGRIQVIGFMTAPDGEQVPVNVSQPFSIDNLN